MLKIGDFSRLSQISIKALRHYDKLGLLQPEEVDKFTGYRYYTLNQLPHAHRIMALKEMGLSLEQIGIMLNQELSADELRGMFRLKQAEIEQRMREDQQRLAMIEFHINMINVEDKMPDLDVVVKDLEAFKALYVRIDRTSRDDMPVLVQEVYQTLAKENMKPVSSQVTIQYGDEINAEDEEWGMAIAMPVDEDFDREFQLPTQGTFTVREIPAVKVATILYQGDDYYDGIEKRTLLRQWAIQNGYRITDEFRFVSLHGMLDGATGKDWLTEFQVIVEKPD